MDVVVIGAGISGLTAGLRLLSQGHAVTVVEKSSEPGGLAAAVDLNGHRLDKYYRHIFRTDTPVLRLISELNLDSDLMWCSSKIGFFSKGTIYPFGTPMDLLRFSPVTLLDRLRFGLTVYALTRREDWSALEQVSAKEWITRWMGPSSYRVIWAPLLKLKFGRFCDEVSAAWIWGRIHPRARSRSGGNEQLGYLKGSYAALMDALAEKISRSGGEMRFSEEVLKVQPSGTKWSVETRKGMLTADAVIVAVPTPDLLRVLEGIPEERLAVHRSVEYLSVHCLLLELDKPLSDIYWLNIVDPGIRFAGVIEHTNFVPTSLYKGKHIVYLFQYLESTHPDFSMGPQETLKAYLPSLKSMFPRFSDSQILGIQLAKDLYATPVYARGYSQRKPPIETGLPGLIVANTSQIYPEDRNMSNGVALAEKAVEILASHKKGFR